MDHADSERSTDDNNVTADSSADGPADESATSSSSKRRRGSRGGQRRRGSGQGSGGSSGDPAAGDIDDPNDIELPKPMSEGRPSAEAAEKALVRKTPDRRHDADADLAAAGPGDRQAGSRR